MGFSSALLICNVNLIPINAVINSNRGILMVFSYGSVGVLGIVTKGVYGNVANLLLSFRHRGTRIASSCQTIPSSLLSDGSATLHPILELPSPFCINIFASTTGQESKWIILNFCTFLQLVPFL